MTPETVPPAEPDPITAATAACTASWSQRYIDHYADDDGRCRRCGAVTDSTPATAAQRFPKAECLTADERNAIRALERLAARWPRSLTLFSAAGSLAVIRTGSYTASVRFEDLALTWISGIPNDGGDP